MEIYRSENDVVLKMTTSLQTSKEVYFIAQCNNPMFAELLTDHLRIEKEKIVQSVRKEEYERGWKDAKAQRKKEDWFSGRFKNIWG